MRFPRQQEALAIAGKLIGKLPANSVWAFSVTEDDDTDSPATLNIFTNTDASWPEVSYDLGLYEPFDTGENFVSYKMGILLISFIEEE